MLYEACWDCEESIKSIRLLHVSVCSDVKYRGWVVSNRAFVVMSIQGLEAGSIHKTALYHSLFRILGLG